MPRPRETQVIYVHDTGGLGETAVVNFNAGQEVELMRPVSSQSVERSGDVAVRTGSGSLGPFRLGCGSVGAPFSCDSMECQGQLFWMLATVR